MRIAPLILLTSAVLLAPSVRIDVNLPGVNISDECVPVTGSAVGLHSSTLQLEGAS